MSNGHHHHVDSHLAAGIGPVAGTAYDRIGGEPAVIGLVEQFFDLVLIDESLRKFFIDDSGGEPVARVELDRIRHHFATLVATMLGASVRYEGRNVEESHRAVGGSAEDFDRMSELFVQTLRLNEVPDDIVIVVAEKFAAVKPLVVQIVRPPCATL